MDKFHPVAKNSGRATPHEEHDREAPKLPACPMCGGPLIEIKQKLQCSQCRAICETCCEGGRG
jgi:hypothetical protein